ncbi:MAG: DUF418 domain-containing protein [Bacteroidia bacterium]
MTGLTAVKLTERIKVMDVIRGFAVLGILLMNIPGFSTHEFFLYWHDTLKGETTTNGILFKGSMILFDGKMRGLFTLLFGAGLMLFIENKQDNSIRVADLYFKRMMWMLFFGLIHAYIFLWGGDILYEYAMCGIFAFAFRNMKARNLLFFSLSILAVVIYFSGSAFLERKEKYIEYKQVEKRLQEHKPVNEKQQEVYDEFVNIKGTFLPFSKEHIHNLTEDIYKREVKIKSDYSTLVVKNAEEISVYHTQEFFMDMWESFATILLGMALFKFGFFQEKLNNNIYRVFAFIGVPLGIALSAISVLNMVYTQTGLIDAMENRNFSINHIGGIGRIILTVSYASTLILLFRVKWLKSFFALFANVGRMALTNYIMETVLCSLYFFGFGLNHYGVYDAKELVLFVSVIWLIQITYSNIYFRFFEMGPLEWLWKRLTYGKTINQ